MASNEEKLKLTLEADSSLYIKEINKTIQSNDAYAKSTTAMTNIIVKQTGKLTKEVTKAMKQVETARVNSLNQAVKTGNNFLKQHKTMQDKHLNQIKTHQKNVEKQRNAAIKKAQNQVKSIQGKKADQQAWANLSGMGWSGGGQALQMATQTVQEIGLQTAQLSVFFGDMTESMIKDLQALGEAWLVPGAAMVGFAKYNAQALQTAGLDAEQYTEVVNKMLEAQMAFVSMGYQMKPVSNAFLQAAQGDYMALRELGIAMDEAYAESVFLTMQSGELTAQMTEMGITTEKVDSMMKNLGITSDMVYDDLTQQEKAVFRLLGAYNLMYPSIEKATELFENEGYVALKEYEKALYDLKVEIGKVGLEMKSNLIPHLTTLMDMFMALSPVVQKALVGFVAFGPAIAHTVIMIGMLKNAWKETFGAKSNKQKQIKAVEEQLEESLKEINKASKKTLDEMQDNLKKMLSQNKKEFKNYSAELLRIAGYTEDEIKEFQKERVSDAKKANKEVVKDTKKTSQEIEEIINSTDGTVEINVDVDKEKNKVKVGGKTVKTGGGSSTDGGGAKPDVGGKKAAQKALKSGLMIGGAWAAGITAALLVGRRWFEENASFEAVTGGLEESVKGVKDELQGVLNKWDEMYGEYEAHSQMIKDLEWVYEQLGLEIGDSGNAFKNFNMLTEEEYAQNMVTWAEQFAPGGSFETSMNNFKTTIANQAKSVLDTVKLLYPELTKEQQNWVESLMMGWQGYFTKLSTITSTAYDTFMIESEKILKENGETWTTISEKSAEEIKVVFDEMIADLQEVKPEMQAIQDKLIDLTSTTKTEIEEQMTWWDSLTQKIRGAGQAIYNDFVDPNGTNPYSGMDSINMKSGGKSGGSTANNYNYNVNVNYGNAPTSMSGTGRDITYQLRGL